MNRSQDRYISDYNNTLSMNRSMSNNAYINNTPNRSRRSPLQIQSNDLNNFNRSRQQRRNETEPWDKTKGPYGVRFDEMEAHMKMQPANSAALKSDSVSPIKQSTLYFCNSADFKTGVSLQESTTAIFVKY